MTFESTVSVCIASFNHGAFIEQAIRSVLDQTYDDVEIIVVDDGSTDDSWPTILRLADMHRSRIFAYQHADGLNHGSAATYNLALEKAQGSIVSWIGSDDVWKPGFLQSVVPVALEVDENVLVYSQVDVVSREGHYIGQVFGADVNDDMFNRVERLLLLGNPIPAMAVVVRRSAVTDAGGFMDGLVYCDWALWIRILSLCPAVFVPKPLADYRVHGGNTSIGVEASLDLAHQLAAIDSLTNGGGAGLLNLPRSRASIELAAARCLWLIDDLTAARQRVLRAIQVHPAIREETGFVIRWLDSLAGGHAHCDPFRLWCLELLVSLGAGKLRSRLAQEMAACAHERRSRGDRVESSVLARGCLRNDLRWMRDRGIVRMAVDGVRTR
jgi:alpha-1,3-rhamnosyltransferase